MTTIECHQCKHPFDPETEGPFCPRCGSRNDEPTSTNQRSGSQEQASYSGGTPVDRTIPPKGTDLGDTYQEVSLEEDVATNFALFGCLGGILWSIFDVIGALFKKLFRL